MGVNSPRIVIGMPLDCQPSRDAGVSDWPSLGWIFATVREEGHIKMMDGATFQYYRGRDNGWIVCAWNTIF